jgi:hypothetical protein
MEGKLMAKFVAVTRIEHGEDTDQGNKVMIFEPGDEVTGLSKETMRELWDAGALSQVDTGSRDEVEENPNG